MFKRLVDAVPEVKFELYSFKSTIKCKEMLEQDCWFENKVTKNFNNSSIVSSTVAFNNYDIKYILGLSTTKLELDKMMGRIN